MSWNDAIIPRSLIASPIPHPSSLNAYCLAASDRRPRYSGL